MGDYNNGHYEGEKLHMEGKDYEWHDGKFRDVTDNSFVGKFYRVLWKILKILIIIGFVAFLLWLRVRFDMWYVNWLMK